MFCSDISPNKWFPSEKGKYGFISRATKLSRRICVYAPMNALNHAEVLVILDDERIHLRLGTYFSFNMKLFQILKPNSQRYFPNIAQSIAIMVAATHV